MHVVIIFKNTNNIILSATLGDFGVIRWENYSAAIQLNWSFIFLIKQVNHLDYNLENFCALSNDFIIKGY